MKKTKQIKTDVVTQLLDNEVDDNVKLTGAWGEVIPVNDEDLADELGRMEGFNTHSRYNSHDDEFEFMGDNNY